MKGGKRTGAGRKKGSKSQRTLEREAVLKAFKERAMRSADVLFNAQLTLARGQTYLFKIEKEKIVGPKGGISYRSKKPEIVTEEWILQSYLEGMLEEGDPDDDQDPGSTYYYLTTKDPNNFAIDSLLDRTFGTPTKVLATEDEEGKRVPITSINVVPLDGPTKAKR